MIGKALRSLDIEFMPEGVLDLIHTQSVFCFRAVIYFTHVSS